MPVRPPRACRCGALIPAGNRCARCYPPWATKSANWPAGSTRRWRTLRAAKLAANPMCQWPHCVRLAEQVDHITPLAEGGDRWAWHNLQSLCVPHHTEKTQAESIRGRHRHASRSDGHRTMS